MHHLIRRRERPIVESLEPRILYSADPGSALLLDATVGFAPVEQRLVVDALPLPAAASPLTAEPAESRHELVFIDGRVADQQALIGDIRRAHGADVEIVLLDPARDGIAQISARLAQEHGLDAVHIVSHGEAGALEIGSTHLDFDTLLADATAVSRWRLALNSGADLMLYGCDLAATGEGRALVDALARLTGADVAASTDTTGGTSVGGDWVLEYSTGRIESAALAGAPDLAAWDAALGLTPSGTETLVNTTTSGAQTVQRGARTVAMDSSGRFVVVWNDPANSGDVYACRFDADGKPLGTQFRVNTTTAGVQKWGTVAMSDSGAFVIVWQSANQDGSGDGIYAQRYDATGTAAGAEFRINQTTADSQNEPSVAMDKSGNFVVTWTSWNGQDGSGTGVYARRFGSSGTALGNEFRVNTTTAGDQGWSSVACDGSGNFVIAWTSWNGQDGSGRGVYARRYDATGAPTSGEFRVNSYLANDQDTPSVAMNASGEFLIAWSSMAQDGSGYGAYAQLYGATGTPLGLEIQLNTATSGDQDYPIAALDSQGNFLVTWESDGQDGSSFGVYGRIFNRNGKPLTNEILINTTTSNVQEYPSVAWNGSKAVCVWHGEGSGDSAGVFFKTIDASAAGITATVVGGKTVTSESGGSQTISVVLDSRPSSDVTVTLGSSDPTEGSISVSITFTPGDWDVPQLVTVTGVDDAMADGDIGYWITGAATSTDASYAGLRTPDIAMVNADDDHAGITVTAISGNTTEAGGAATFGIMLTSQPTADVTISIASSDTTEGTVSTSSLTFTAANWNVVQVVTVTGVDDALDDGDIGYTIVTGAAVSADTLYNGRGVSDLATANIDNDTAGVAVSAINGDTTEAGGSATFGVVLTSQPTADVTVSIASSNTAEGTVSTSSLVFTAANWNVAQVVTVTGVDDAVVDGNVAYSIVTGAAASADADYNGMAAADVAVINVDNDTAGVSVSAIGGNTTEAGGTATFSVQLTSQPTADVAISIASGNAAEGTVSTSSLTFTAANWNVAQVVTVTGVDDAFDDGDIAYSVVTGATSSADARYNGLGVGDVGVTNIDNDTAGVTVSAISGNTTEAGGTATFGVQLTSQPTADVTITITSSDTTEGTVSTSTLTFTSANWYQAQTVTVTGVNDAADDGDIVYSIVTGDAVSNDANYDQMTVADVGVTNVDDDSAGLTVSSTDVKTSERGATGNVTVALTSQPTANVTVSVRSRDTTEATVSVSALTFTPANWNVAQTVSVTGVDDAIADGDQPYAVDFYGLSSADPLYNTGGSTTWSMMMLNYDDEVSPVVVSPISNSTTEAGGTATFTVSLTTAPVGGTVYIPISSGNAAEGTVSTSGLTFTPSNWYTSQTVTVTGVDDAVDDGDAAYSLTLGTVVSGDDRYSGLDPADVTVTNVDNDNAGVTVSAISGNTTEAGGTATFSVQLTSQPMADVTLAITSGNTAEGTVSTSALTFTSANWNVAQVVTVTGVDDAIDDGDVSYSIVTGAATSADASYNGIAVNDVAVTNVDNDTPGVSVSAISGNTAEAGATASFSVILTSQPTANVTIAIASSDTTEGTVSASSLTFTPANWNVAQVVTVTGVDDALDDGDIAYSIVTGAASSADASYDGLAIGDVAVTNVDNDTAGVSVSAISGNTTEASGTATFSVVLTSQPTADVTISVASNDTTEGTVSTSSLTFTSANWNVAQVVTVTGVDDALDDGDIGYTVVTGAAASADSGYNGMAVNDVAVTNVDDDTVGVIVSAISGNTTEAGGAATFSVTLTSQPTADVTIAIASNDPTEGTVSTSSLTFTAANWNVAQVVTVTGVDDAVDDGDISYAIVTGAATSADAGYNGMAVGDVTVTNVDNDNAGITVSAISGPTTEAGGTATFSAVLTSQPMADVTIAIASGNTAEGTVSTSSLTFTATNWNVAQVVTVTGVDDAVDDGNIAYSIVTGAASSADAGYNGMAVNDVAVMNVDNDTAGVSVSPVSGSTTEAGATASFSVTLASQPTADVTIAIASSDTSEGTVSTSSLTFTSANWNIPQQIVVTGVDDAVADGTVGYSIVTGAAVSADASYNGLPVTDIALSNADNDNAGITVSPISGNTSEASVGATFIVVLNSQPTADVTLSIASSNPAEGTVSTSALTFTAANWNIAQVVTVTGVDDALDDGDITYSIVTGAAVSGDAGYNGMAAADVTVTNVDNDSAGVSVSAISSPTTEAGGTATFSVVLTSQPTADVTISVASSDTTEGTVSTSTLTFTAANWNVAQVVTVTGVDDALDDSNIAYSIVTGAAASADAGYNGMAVGDVAVTNVDNDSAGVVVSAISGPTTEAGGTATFSVQLTSQPAANVTISIASNDTTEGTVSTSSLTFTAANWNVAQVVTVTGVDDAVADGNIAYSIVAGAATSADAGYNGMAVNDVAVTNLDDETAPRLALPATLSTNEDTTLPLSSVGLGITDPNGDLARVDLSVAHGTLDIRLAAGGASIAAGAAGSRGLALVGTQAQIDAALSTLTYTGDADWSGLDALGVTATDAAGLQASGTVGIDVASVDDAPVVTSTDQVTIPEGQMAVATVTSTDIDGGAAQYSIVGGADAALFVIDARTGALRMRQAPDAAAPADANRDNVYEVTVQVSDGQGGIARQAMTVSVLDRNTAPTIGVPPLSIPAGGVRVLGPNDLIAADVDSPDSSLVFTVDHVVNGHFELASQPGAAVTSFSETALEAGLVSLVHEAGAAAPEFTIAVSDGRATSGPLHVQAVLDQEPHATLKTGDATAPSAATSATGSVSTASPPSTPQVAALVPSVTTTAPLAAPQASRPTEEISVGTTRTIDVSLAPAVLRLPTDPTDSNEPGTLAAFGNDPLRTLLLQLNHAPGASRDTQEGGSPHIAIPSGEQEDTDGSGLQAVILQTLGMALTVGSVWWALRITGLLGTLMASLPVWRQIDLLPVLADDEDEDDPPSDPDDDDDESARDEAAVGRHLFVEPGARA